MLKGVNMPSKTDKSTSKASAKPGRSQRLTLFFFRRPRKTALIWLVIALFGATCYATFLKREGFPSINTPFAIASGSYLAHDPAKVDTDVAKPLSDFLVKQDGVKAIQAQSFGDYYNVIVNYKDGVNSDAKSKALSKAVAARHLLPEKATFKLSPYEFGFTQRGDDLVVSFYNKQGSTNTEDLVAQAQKAAAFIKAKHLPLVHDVSVINPFE